MTVTVVDRIADRLSDNRKVWRPLPHQVPPDDIDFLWLLLAGRGSGKTDACARYLNEHVMGPPCDERVPGGHRPMILAPTLGDAIDACVNGPSGLRAHNPEVRAVQGPGGTYVRWPNGTVGKLFGAHTPEDVERLRAGGNRCLAWAEELAAWRHLDDAFAHMRYGLRVGAHPHVIASTTPKPRKLIKDLTEDPRTTVTRASTRDNPHLVQAVRDDLYARYGGTRLGRQELDAELLEDVEGALWQRDWIDRTRVREVPALARVAVGVDPSVGLGASHHDHCGIVVVARGVDGDWYVVADRSIQASPDSWVREVVATWETFGGTVCVETNQGGEVVVALLRQAMPNLPIRRIHAHDAKVVRAEPVATLYEQGRVHHVGSYPFLEDEQCTWVVGDPSPNRIDALVHAFSDLPAALGRTWSPAEAEDRMADEEPEAYAAIAPQSYGARHDAQVWVPDDVLSTGRYGAL